MNIKPKEPKDLGAHWCSKCGSVQPFKQAERGTYVRCQTCKTLFLSLMEEPQAKAKTVTKND